MKKIIWYGKKRVYDEVIGHEIYNLSYDLSHELEKVFLRCKNSLLLLKDLLLSIKQRMMLLENNIS